MALHPEVQEEANVELDAVVGRKRLPIFEDRVKLPYINAIVRELLRWHSVVPTGLAHHVMQDDNYQGYWIPKNSIVIPNIWYALLMSSLPLENSRTDVRWVKGVLSRLFRSRVLPARALLEKRTVQTDPYAFVFGFGRR